MSTFYYTAKTHDGKTKSGTIEAKDKHSLAQILRRKGFILTSAQSLEAVPTSVGIPTEVGRKLKGILGRVSLAEKMVFTRHLAVMIGAGFSLHKALETLAQQTKNQNFKKIIRDIVIRIKKGEALADALSKYSKVFNNFFVSMVKVGERAVN